MKSRVAPASSVVDMSDIPQWALLPRVQLSRVILSMGLNASHARAMVRPRSTESALFHCMFRKEQDTQLFPASVAERHSAIDYELRTRYEAALIREEKQGCMGNILRLLGTPKRHLRIEQGAGFVGA